jgi:hypothetical protein
MITRPPTLSPEEMDRLLERLADRGARITMQDPRVTSVQNWILTGIGTSLLGLVAWGVNSINELSKTLTVVVTQNDYRDKWVGRIETHVEAVDSRVVDLERKAPR